MGLRGGLFIYHERQGSVVVEAWALLPEAVVLNQPSIHTGPRFSPLYNGGNYNAYLTGLL